MKKDRIFLFVIDSTFYYKRSRGRKCGIEYISSVKGKSREEQRKDKERIH